MNPTDVTIDAATRQDWRTRLLLRRLERLQSGTLELLLPDGGRACFRGAVDGPSARVKLHSSRLVSRLVTGGALGLAEGYMAGEWDSPELAVALELLHRNEASLRPAVPALAWTGKMLGRLRHRLRANSRRGARRNIAYHYDLGNSFYARWLDETWTYSAALFAYPEQPLAEAQRAKYQRLLDRLAPRPGEHILEIGCGWGGFACYAAAHADVRVTGLTLSEEQLAFARKQAEAAGLSDRIAFVLRDYRDVTQRFDHIVSIEMYEAVGEAYWPDYFAAIRAALKPGGRAALQAITIDEAGFELYRRRADFIQRYIFPGGMLASPSVFGACAARAGLDERERAFFGGDYARTLARWDHRVTAEREAIVAERGETFYRMWRYYLAYCTAGFSSGHIDLMQIVFEQPGAGE
ncbi:class I SAM-dependent methyltransferase [Salinisphaera sp. Q1T1-3]|nr:class I SAM-dependent methyltransferase [Salinisphaera sp. Q1T1-3]